VKCAWPTCETEIDEEAPEGTLCEACRQRGEEAIATGGRAAAMLDAFQRSLDAPFTTPLPKRGKPS
jgi:hypothetical protein